MKTVDFVDDLCYNAFEVIQMADFRERFAELLNRSAENDRAIADALGVSKQTVSAWKNGERSPKQPTLVTIANHFHVGVAWLTGRTDDPAEGMEPRPLPANLRLLSDLRRQRVPLIGRVAAGQPIMAEQDYETYVSAPVECDAALAVQGESMKPTYLPGDIIYIKRQPDVREGQVAVVLIDDEATLKHVYKRREGLTLISDNPDYPPMLIDAADHEYIAIYGVPVGYTRMYGRENGIEGRISKGFPKK